MMRIFRLTFFVRSPKVTPLLVKLYDHLKIYIETNFKTTSTNTWEKQTFTFNIKDGEPSTNLKITVRSIDGSCDPLVGAVSVEEITNS